MNKDEWIAKATAAMQHWCERHKGMAGNFESLRAEVSTRLDEAGEGPTDGRWWGAVNVRLRRSGALLPSWGWMPAQSSNRAPKPVWKVKG